MSTIVAPGWGLVLTLVWVGILGVRFEVGGGENYARNLKFGTKLVSKYTH